MIKYVLGHDVMGIHGVMRFRLFCIHRLFIFVGYVQKTSLWSVKFWPFTIKSVVFQNHGFDRTSGAWFSTLRLIRWTHWRILVLYLVPEAPGLRMPGVLNFLVNPPVIFRGEPIDWPCEKWWCRCVLTSLFASKHFPIRSPGSVLVGGPSWTV